jgi:hypothetical protein
MYTSSITIDNVVDAIVTVLQPFFPVGSQITRAQVNEDGQYTIRTPKRIDIQIDFYGELSGDYINAFTNSYRTIWMADQFPSGIAPLYCSNPLQAPLITGEMQYASRWIVTASFQYNSVVIVPQGQATSLAMKSFTKVDIL